MKNELPSFSFSFVGLLICPLVCLFCQSDFKAKRQLRRRLYEDTNQPVFFSVHAISSVQCRRETNFKICNRY